MLEISIFRKFFLFCRNRCAVWTEPGILDRCAYEFADVESILQIAESI